MRNFGAEVLIGQARVLELQSKGGEAPLEAVMLSFESMKQNHPIPPGLTILCLTLLAGGALFAADSNPDGWVVAVGHWTRGKQVLRQYDAVFANDTLQGTSGQIVVALKDGQSPHPYHCDKFPCTVTIQIGRASCRERV